MWTSPSVAVSGAELATRKSFAYQSLQPSPIAPACGEFSAPAPARVDDQPVREPVRVLVVDDRGVVAGVDRCGIAGSTGTSASAATSPSGGVYMLALLTVASSTSAPSLASQQQPVGALEGSAVGEADGARRWSWKRLAR